MSSSWAGQGPERLAIIKNVKFGVDDRGRVTLRFSTYITENSAADQMLPLQEAEQAMLTAGVSDISELNGWPCWVDTSVPSILRFVRMWKR